MAAKLVVVPLPTSLVDDAVADALVVDTDAVALVVDDPDAVPVVVVAVVAAVAAPPTCLPPPLPTIVSLPPPQPPLSPDLSSIVTVPLIENGPGIPDAHNTVPPTTPLSRQTHLPTLSTLVEQIVLLYKRLYSLSEHKKCVGARQRTRKWSEDRKTPRPQQAAMKTTVMGGQ